MFIFSKKKNKKMKKKQKLQKTDFENDFVHLPFQDSSTWKIVESIDASKVKNFASLERILESISRNKDMDVSSLQRGIESFSDGDFFGKIFPTILKLVLEMPKRFRDPLKYLTSSGEMTFTKSQVSCFLACSFLCLFSRPSEEMLWSHFGPSLNLDQMFMRRPNPGVQSEKVKMYLNYFGRISEREDLEDKNNVVVVRRVSRKYDEEEIFSIMKGCKFGEVDIRLGVIEEAGNRALHVDFANRYVGGASLSYGCVQEEIAFTIKPELNISRLVSPPMENHEVIIISNTEQFSRYKGYASSLQYDGNYEVEGEYGNQLCAMDARNYMGNKKRQYSPSEIFREFQKSYVGFSSTSLDSIATGNWGGGVFCGDKDLKFLIQWISASLAKKKLIFFTVVDKKQKEGTENFVHKFLDLVRKREMDVHDVYQILKDIEPPVFDNVLESLGNKK